MLGYLISLTQAWLKKVFVFVTKTNIAKGVDASEYFSVSEISEEPMLKEPFDEQHDDEYWEHYARIRQELLSRVLFPIRRGKTLEEQSDSDEEEWSDDSWEFAYNCK
ncbi:BSD domain-containing protein [Caenorhabditis elegans]|uniref:BSD domain-containing protein n=1 Tax=Caenorhabditis elegans TaxID=6239 RepID=O16290_CAEEL|nr:BSD domain-containing protein [Caenorhabditis elegans]CCD68488.2 BSD domain-containing protein [Caenorhabditis elegans]|eukprot:NP_504206.3 Uncharacterized protein CELE_F32D1.8 [Caenorhabditis elegans]